MIKITYYGHSCFELDFDGYKIVLDPFTGVPGYNLGTIDANEVLPSHGHGDHAFVEAVKLTNAAKPAELNVVTVDSFHDKELGALRGPNKLQIFEYKGLRVMHCGDMGVMPTEEQMSLMKNLDAVMIPVGGTFTLAAEESKEFAEKIGAKLIIPMHYRHETCGFDKITTRDHFAELFESVTYANSCEIEITGETKGVVILDAKSRI
ncbi:MAG: MBL fold metallo-hydrolase [Clostridia bacterium]|nr:MBL fold metallo-hydrolase [Clostridia bacterium]